jgi:CRISPR-associated endonuclease/helicase Cas3
MVSALRAFILGAGSTWVGLTLDGVSFLSLTLRRASNRTQRLVIHHSDTLNNNTLSFWGKSSPANKFAKPVLHHMLDVAAVAESLILFRPQMARWLAQQLELSPKQLAPLVAFLTGLHDLGKISLPFQSKSSDHWPTENLGAMDSWTILSNRNHWECTAELLQDEAIARILEQCFPNLCGSKQLVAVVAGHHGRAPSNEVMGSQLSKKNIPPVCVRAATEIVQFLANKFISEPIPELNETSLTRASFALNGLVTVADWVGSDTACFPFPEHAPRVEELEDYWQYVQHQAQSAVIQKGLAGATPINYPSYNLLKLPCAGKLRPMQSAVETVEITDNPQLFIVEDTTGSGKTESALLLAGRLMTAGCAEGIYFALPTMATANAMHGRLKEEYKNFYDYDPDEGEPSLVLAHGRAKLARQLTALRLSTGGDDAESTRAYCASFIADSRKLALFADIGIGTIDQAFLGVLRKKHLTLRQFALSNRILIVDEAHAFDAYMGEELKTLLRVQAMNGGSAIVLSATLPQAKRHEFAQAFVDGLPPTKQVGSGYAAQYVSETIELKSQCYPLLTCVGAEGAEEIEVAFDQRLARTIKIEPIKTRDESVALALKAAAQGAAVAIICNAVDEAIGVYNKLAAIRKNTEKLMLFHARFTVGDRMNIEQNVLELFGKDSTAEKRQGHILVATQVIEQSLDLDFDLVISDLAPIDLLIQRAGRLWRHMTQRPQTERPLKEPVLAVLMPDPNQVKDAKWLEETLGKAAYIYKNPAVMWRSAKILTEQGNINIPEYLRPMIEHVYQQDDVDIPNEFLASLNEAEGNEYQRQSLAGFNVIDVAGGYMTCQHLGQDENIGTRDGDATITVRLARQAGNQLVPFHLENGADERLNWELSEIAVRQSWKEAVQASKTTGSALTALLKTWPEFEQDIAVLVIDDESVDKCLSYNPLFGLIKKQLN